MRKITTIVLATLASVSVMAASPAFAAKKDKAGAKQTQSFKGKNKGIEYQPVIVAGSKKWIQRLYVGRGPGFNGGFSGHPGGGGR